MADAPAAPAPKRMGLFKKILIGFVLVIAVFAGVVALQPADYTVTRSAEINAPASAVFANVNEFRKWEAWSPWEKLDPAMKKTFEGPASGTGAVYAWVGNDKVGEGRMTLQESRAPELIKIELHFLKPFEDRCNTEFAFKPAGAGTAVTWTMTGHKNFISKAICLFMDMDKMVGGDFERGLAALKSVSEPAPAK